MENIIKIKGYHTCKLSGWENAPFLSVPSKPNDRQWLTQGYYFWTDSDHFAHKWGKDSIKGNYAIVECLIEIEKDSLLDLVGSVEDQLYFEEMVNEYYKILKRENPQAKEPTVNVVLSYYRELAKTNKNFFPYNAIKAQDGYYKSKIIFLENKKEFLPLLTRQQLCLFDFASDCIKSKNIVYPDQFKI